MTGSVTFLLNNALLGITSQPSLRIPAALIALKLDTGHGAQE